jgi:TPR repeat protein
MGVFYSNGYGVVMDADQAMVWYRRAAEAGHVDAMRKLGYVVATTTRSLATPSPF